MLGAGVMAFAACASASAASLVSSIAYAEVIFTHIREIPNGQPSGRSGLSYQTFIDAYGFTGGSAADADSDVNIDLGYIGGFPDGKAPLPGSGMWIKFNPYATCTSEGDAFGIGALWLRHTLTDKTNGKSRWEIDCQVTTWVQCQADPCAGEIDTSFWRAQSGLDLTDSEQVYERWIVQDQGFMPQTGPKREGPTQYFTIVIDGTPGEDPATAVLNLRTEAEATVRHGPVFYGPVYTMDFWNREADVQTK